MRELKTQEVKWKEEREELRKCVKEMESKMEEAVRGDRWRAGGREIESREKGRLWR